MGANCDRRGPRDGYEEKLDVAIKPFQEKTGKVCNSGHPWYISRLICVDIGSENEESGREEDLVSFYASKGSS